MTGVAAGDGRGPGGVPGRPDPPAVLVRLIPGRSPRPPRAAAFGRGGEVTPPRVRGCVRWVGDRPGRRGSLRGVGPGRGRAPGPDLPAGPAGRGAIQAAAAAALAQEPGIEAAWVEGRFRVAWADGERFLGAAPGRPESSPSRRGGPGPGQGSGPDDPLFLDGSQWGLRNEGAGPFGGIAGADIRAAGGLGGHLGLDRGSDRHRRHRARCRAPGPGRHARRAAGRASSGPSTRASRAGSPPPRTRSATARSSPASPWRGRTTGPSSTAAGSPAWPAAPGATRRDAASSPSRRPRRDTSTRWAPSWPRGSSTRSATAHGRSTSRSAATTTTTRCATRSPTPRAMGAWSSAAPGNGVDARPQYPGLLRALRGGHLGRGAALRWNAGRFLEPRSADRRRRAGRPDLLDVPDLRERVRQPDAQLRVLLGHVVRRAVRHRPGGTRHRAPADADRQRVPAAAAAHGARRRRARARRHVRLGRARRRRAPVVRRAAARLPARQRDGAELDAARHRQRDACARRGSPSAAAAWTGATWPSAGRCAPASTCRRGACSRRRSASCARTPRAAGRTDRCSSTTWAGARWCPAPRAPTGSRCARTSTGSRRRRWPAAAAAAAAAARRSTSCPCARRTSSSPGARSAGSTRRRRSRSPIRRTTARRGRSTRADTLRWEASDPDEVSWFAVEVSRMVARSGRRAPWIDPARPRANWPLCCSVRRARATRRSCASPRTTGTAASGPGAGAARAHADAALPSRRDPAGPGRIRVPAGGAESGARLDRVPLRARRRQPRRPACARARTASAEPRIALLGPAEDLVDL